MHTRSRITGEHRAHPPVRPDRPSRAETRDRTTWGTGPDAATSFRPYGPDTDTPGKVGARARRACSAAPPPTLSRLELSASSLHSDSLGCGSVRTVSLVSAHVGGTKNSSSFLTGHVLTSAQSTNALLLLRLPSQHTSSRRSSRRSHAGSGHGRCGERHPPTAPSDEPPWLGGRWSPMAGQRASGRHCERSQMRRRGTPAAALALTMAPMVALRTSWAVGRASPGSSK
jgi:hypothetical protein